MNACLPVPGSISPGCRISCPGNRPAQGTVLPTVKMCLSASVYVIKRPNSQVILDSVSLAVHTPSHTHTLCQKYTKWKEKKKRNTLNASFVQSILFISWLVNFKDQMGLFGLFDFVVVTFGAESETQGLIQAKQASHNWTMFLDLGLLSQGLTMSSTWPWTQRLVFLTSLVLECTGLYHIKALNFEKVFFFFF